MSDEVLGAVLRRHIEECGPAVLTTAIDIEAGTGLLACAWCGTTLVEFTLRGVDDERQEP
jgi:hypothetical protein